MANAAASSVSNLNIGDPMTNILQNFTFKTAVLRASQLLRGYGLTKTMAVAAAKIDDQYLKLFDRKYNIATSGHVELCDTSFDPSKLSRATAYGPVNGWAFRGLLRELSLPKAFHFVDLGSGLGRPCIIAADYGFERVTGVELAFELHTTALENVNESNLSPAKKAAIHLIHGDVLEYCDHTDDDVFFIFRAFSLDFYDVVRSKLAARAASRKKTLTIIYTERLGKVQGPEVEQFRADRRVREVMRKDHWGQNFFVYECGG
jgi:SAM-dependent methyltransferase